MIEGKTKLLWNDVHILGCFDRETGKSYLTTWVDNEDSVYVDVVITGIGESAVPYWGNPVPEQAELHEIPEGSDKHEYAKELGGILAFGWLLK